MQFFSELPGASSPPALCPGPARGLAAPPDPQLYRAMTFGTIDHIQSLHKFPYISPIFLPLMSYNTLYFYLKLPINYLYFVQNTLAGLKIVSLLKDFKSEGGKIIHFWKALYTGFSEIPKSLPQVLQVKRYSDLSPKSVVTHVSSLETPTSFEITASIFFSGG